MQFLAQHKGLTLSIALVVGSVALAPAMASGDLAGDLGLDATADDVMASLSGKASGAAGDASASGSAKGKVKAAVGGDAGAAELDDLTGTVDPKDLNLRKVVEGDLDNEAGTAAYRTGVQVTDQQAHLNPDLGVDGEHGSAATENGVHLNYADPTDPSAAVESGADLDTEHLGASADLTGGN